MGRRERRLVEKILRREHAALAKKAASETSTASRSEWSRVFDVCEHMKSFFREAYLDAVAPIFARAIEFYNQPQVRILVVGGGTGHFSRVVLPHVQQILRQRGHHAEIEVMETDVSETIRDAPAPSKIVAVQKLEKEFDPSSFDLVIGESMIHQVGPRGIGKSISQIAKVLKPNGSFIHIQDNPPAPLTWADRALTRKQSALSILQKVTPAWTERDKQALVEMMMSAHDNLRSAVLSQGSPNNLHGAHFNVSGNAVVPATRRYEVPGFERVSRFNHVQFHYGQVNPTHDPAIPRDQRKLDYKGIVVILSKHPQFQELFRIVQPV